jgi:hypothetical protein
VDFSFSDEQVLVRDTIRKYLAAEYDSVARKRIVATSAVQRGRDPSQRAMAAA